jgi:hypothetical protein
VPKPNYRHQKKQKEDARKARALQKRERKTERVEPEADPVATPAVPSGEQTS